MVALGLDVVDILAISADSALHLAGHHINLVGHARNVIEPARSLDEAALGLIELRRTRPNVEEGNSPLLKLKGVLPLQAACLARCCFVLSGEGPAQWRLSGPVWEG